MSHDSLPAQSRLVRLWAPTLLLFVLPVHFFVSKRNQSTEHWWLTLTTPRSCELDYISWRIVSCGQCHMTVHVWSTYVWLSSVCTKWICENSAMAYPQMESAGDAGLLPMPGDGSYPPTGGAAYPPPPGYDHGEWLVPDKIVLCKGKCFVCIRDLLMQHIFWKSFVTVTS